MERLTHRLSAWSLRPAGLTPALQKVPCYHKDSWLKKIKRKVDLGGETKVKSQTSHPAGFCKLETFVVVVA